MWLTVGQKNQNSGNSEQIYEYIYFGGGSIPGYSVNMSTGVLTAIPDTPAVAVNTLSVGKISNNAQVLEGDSGSGQAFWINPTTGILNPVTGSGYLASNGPQNAVFSPSGLFIYSIAASQTNGWIAQVDPTTGDFSNAVETANFSAPFTNGWSTVLSPNGNYVYFVDPYDNIVEGYSTSGGALNLIAGVNIGTGVTVGDQTYGKTLLPAPNAGNYNQYAAPYVNTGANVIYFFYLGAIATDDNWLMPYKINSDGSLTAGTPLNMGATGGNIATPVGDSTGKYLFLNPAPGSGISTYSIGLNGSLTFVSGPIYAGDTFMQLLINSENSLLYGDKSNGASHIETASINMTTGFLTPASNVANTCGGPTTFTTVLDPSESFIYAVGGGNLCGWTVSSSGVLGTILGQTYPLALPTYVETV
jgi:hypothetical protein